MIIPNPTVQSWLRWSETLIGFNDILKTQLELVPEEKWKEFGRRFCLVVPLAPRPEFHKSWRDWGRSLQMAVGD